MGVLSLCIGLLELLAESRLVFDSLFAPRLAPSDLGDNFGWLFVLLSIPAFAVPILGERGIFLYDYYSAPKELQARADVVLGLLSLPAVLNMAVSASAEGCSSGLNCRLLAVAFGVYVAYMLYSLYIWKTHG